MDVNASPPTVYLLRHAKAKRRDAWTRPDHLRPLTDAGRRQAERLGRELGAVLAGTDPARVLSSPFLRCRQTVEPLAGVLGVSLELDDALAEGAGPAFDLLHTLDGPAVLCSHGDVIEETVARLAAGGVRFDGPAMPRKGGAWALRLDGGAVAAARYLPPPDGRAGG